MSDTIFVMAGGAIGAACRYHVGRLLAPFTAASWPTATFMVNLTGGLAMGLLAGWLMRSSVGDGWRLFVGVGILGGFTTFSAFSIEMLQILQDGRWSFAAGYAAASVAGSVALAGVGLWLARSA